MKTSKRIHRFQNLFPTLTYSISQISFINSLKPIVKEDWDKGLKITGRIRGTVKLRDDLKNYIRIELQKIQFPNCIYCGFHEEIVGNLQRDHIAPKDIYPDFMFEAENLALACASCNGFLKKSNFDTMLRYNSNYSLCKFKIIHPYRDKYYQHLDFQFSSNNLIVKHKKFSRKGKATITLFGLNNPIQVSLRGAAIMQGNVKLPPNLELLVQNALKNDYSS